MSGITAFQLAGSARLFSDGIGALRPDFIADWPDHDGTVSPGPEAVAAELRQVLGGAGVSLNRFGAGMAEKVRESGARRTGVSLAEIKKFLSKPNPQSGSYRTLAGMMGYVIPREHPAPEELPWTGEIFYYNAELADEIDRRMRETRLSLCQLTQRTQVYNLQILFASLRKTVDAGELVPPLVARENVQKICRELHIQVHTQKGLPEICVPAMRDRMQTVLAIVTALRKRQIDMRFSRNNLVEMSGSVFENASGCSDEAITDVMAGHVTLDNLHVLERLAALLHVSYDPLSFMDDVSVLEGAGKDAIGGMMRQQVDQRAILSREALGRKFGLSFAKINHIFNGAYDPDDAVFNELRRFLRVRYSCEIEAAAPIQDVQVDAPEDGLFSASAERRSKHRWWEEKRQQAVLTALQNRRDTAAEQVTRKHEILPRIDSPRLLDADLAALISRRRELLGLTWSELYRHAGVHRDSVVAVMEILRQPVATRDTTCFRGHHTLMRVAAFLEIPLVSNLPMDELKLNCSGHATQDVTGLMAVISLRRRSYLITYKQVLDATGVAITAQQEMEAGQFRAGSMDYIRKLLPFFAIRCDGLPEVWPVRGISRNTQTRVISQETLLRQARMAAAAEQKQIEVQKRRLADEARAKERERHAAQKQQERAARKQARDEAAVAREQARREAMADKARKPKKTSVKKPGAAAGTANKRTSVSFEISTRELTRRLLQASPSHHHNGNSLPESFINQARPPRLEYPDQVATAQADAARLKERYRALLTGDNAIWVAPDLVHRRSEKVVWLEAIQLRLQLRGWGNTRTLASEMGIEPTLAWRFLRGLSLALAGSSSQADELRAGAAFLWEDPVVLRLATAMGIYTHSLWKKVYNGQSLPDRLPDPLHRVAFADLVGAPI